MTLETSRLIMRPWQQQDAKSLYEYAKDPRIGPAAGWPVHSSEQESCAIIKNVFSAPQTFAVVLKETMLPVGSIGFIFGKNSNIPMSENEAELGFWIGVPYWGQGLIPEAAGEIIRYGFEELKLNKIWCGYFDGNEKSHRAQQKLGFSFVRTEKDILWELTNEIKTEHITCLCKQDWIKTSQK